MHLNVEQLLRVGRQLRAEFPQSAMPRIRRAIEALQRGVLEGVAEEADWRLRIHEFVRACVSAPSLLRVVGSSSPDRRCTTPFSCKATPS